MNQYKVVASIVEQGPLGEVSYTADVVFAPTLAEAKEVAKEFAANITKDGGRIEKLQRKKVCSSGEWCYGLAAYEDNHRRYEFVVYKS